jgi:hypothetical protein
MNAEFQHLMSLREDQVDEEIVELVLTKIFGARKSGIGSVTAILWCGNSFTDQKESELLEDFLNQLLPFGFTVVQEIESFEICERNAQDQHRLSVSVLSVELPVLEITISDTQNPHNVRRILIQGRANVLSFLEKFSYRLHVQEA